MPRGTETGAETGGGSGEGKLSSPSGGVSGSGNLQPGNIYEIPSESIEREEKGWKAFLSDCGKIVASAAKDAAVEVKDVSASSKEGRPKRNSARPGMRTRKSSASSARRSEDAEKTRLAGSRSTTSRTSSKASRR